VASDESGLRTAWRRWLPGEPDEVLDRYREPGRRYHSVRHLAAVVRDVGRGLAQAPEVDDPGSVVAAAFFHDAVYDATAHDNEARSAALADRLLGAADPIGWPTARRMEVTRLIESTAGHQADDPAAAVLADADLAILGASPSAYAAYVRAVRAEYAHVDDDAWRAGRQRVLEQFTVWPVIYRTALMAPLEPRAQANLRAEIESLALGHQ
jgi:predicted metal-dependent HD superfamily phosphohydrolase